MTASETIRTRASVRHFVNTPIPDSIVQAIIEDASWAPSAGNMQPWQVAVLSEKASSRFRERYEALGWESVLPSLRVALLSHASNHQKSSREINQQVMQIYHEQVVVKGTPRVIAIYYNKPTFTEFNRLSLAALSLYWHRMRAVKSPMRKFAAFLQLVLRSRRDYQVAQNAVKASLANFTYGLTLAATQRGLDSCIQFSYNHAFPWLRKDLKLSRKQKLFGVVLIGVSGKPAGLEGVNSRNRRPVDIQWLPTL